jgi:DNA recombination protein RmuC
MTDVNRLRERVLDLQRHFGLLSGDVEKIVTTTEKIAGRSRKIENLELEEPRGKTVAANGGATQPS